MLYCFAHNLISMQDDRNGTGSDVEAQASTSLPPRPKDEGTSPEGNTPPPVNAPSSPPKRPKGASSSSSLPEPSLDPYVGKLERFELSEQIRSFHEGALAAEIEEDLIKQQIIAIFASQQGGQPQAIDLLLNEELHGQAVLTEVEQELY